MLLRTKRSKGSARQLDDAELDSGDDEGRVHRAQLEDYERDEEDAPRRELNVRETSIGRHAIPRGSDGEVYCQRLSPLGQMIKLTSSAGLPPQISQQCRNRVQSFHFGGMEAPFY